MLAATTVDVTVVGTGIKPLRTRPEPEEKPSRERAALRETPHRGHFPALRSIKARHAGHILSEVSKEGSFDISAERTAVFSFSSLNRSLGGNPISIESYAARKGTELEL